MLLRKYIFFLMWSYINHKKQVKLLLNKSSTKICNNLLMDIKWNQYFAYIYSRDNDVETAQLVEMRLRKQKLSLGRRS